MIDHSFQNMVKPDGENIYISYLFPLCPNLIRFFWWWRYHLIFFVKRHKGQIREAKRSSRLIKGLMMNWSTWADHVWLSQNWYGGFMVKPAKWLCFIILLIVKYFILQSHPGLLYNGIVTHMSGFCSWDQLRYNGSLVISWDIIMRHRVEV